MELKKNEVINIKNKLTTISKATANIMNAMSSEMLSELGATKEYIDSIIAIKEWADSIHSVIVRKEIKESYDKITEYFISLS